MTTLEYTLSVPLLILLIQLGGAYLRYLPFERICTKELRSQLAKLCLLWSVLAFFLYYYIFAVFGLRIIVYKLLLFLGWIPYFLLTAYVIRCHMAQHIFIFGMQTIYVFLLHTLSISVIPYMPVYANISRLILIQGICYLAFFFLLLPLGKKIFRQLLPSRQFINDKSYGHYIALLPLFIIISHISFVIDNKFHSWQELVSRCMFAGCFFLIYRYTKLEAKDTEKQNMLTHSNKLLSSQLQSLQDYTLLMQDSQKQLSILRHDMRHQARLLYTLIQEEKFPEALGLLQTVDNHLEKTALHPYCKNPIINAAFSIYIKKAQRLGIEVSAKINLPEKTPADENDLAVLLSNLMENAIIASLKQPADRRKITITAQTKENQVILCLENLYDIDLSFGEDGLPKTSAAGHGTGMASFTAFVKKYHAVTSFTQENGLVKVLIYWKFPAA